MLEISCCRCDRSYPVNEGNWVFVGYSKENIPIEEKMCPVCANDEAAKDLSRLKELFK